MGNFINRIIDKEYIIIKRKLKNEEYISNYLYQKIINKYKELIHIDFEIDSYNEAILEREYLKYKDYFDGMYYRIDDNIKLDKEQIKAILADEVIVLGLDNNFPNKKSNYFWLEYLFKSFPDEEKIPFAEERRLFYVALTRTKNHVYLLVNKNERKRSIFINEIKDIIEDNK